MTSSSAPSSPGGRAAEVQTAAEGRATVPMKLFWVRCGRRDGGGEDGGRERVERRG